MRLIYALLGLTPQPVLVPVRVHGRLIVGHAHNQSCFKGRQQNLCGAQVIRGKPNNLRYQALASEMPLWRAFSGNPLPEIADRRT